MSNKITQAAKNKKQKNTNNGFSQAVVFLIKNTYQSTTFLMELQGKREQPQATHALSGAILVNLAKKKSKL